MTTRALVLGAGNVGYAVACDLARERDWRVTVVDSAPERLAAVQTVDVDTRRIDLTDRAALRTLTVEHDVVIGALPSALGFRTLSALVESGARGVDVSFMPENALELDAAARANHAVAVVDCGVAPGLSHMMAGDAIRRLAICERVAIYVGGLPEVRTPPFEYKAGFSPWDVLEEYTRPARVVEGARLLSRDSLTGLEAIEVPGVGTLEAFLTDGLRSLLILDVPNMTEKTLRYPGHARLMRALRDAGFFARTPIDIGGQRITPIDVTAALLFPHWKYADDEADLTVLRVEVDGRLDGAAVRLRWDMIDRFDPETRLRSMSRTTAFPAAIVARLVAAGAFDPGVHPPETVGRVGLLDHVIRELAARGVHCTSSESPAPSQPVTRA
jgi:saccharopine dehydrogenase-like NADP-dependent oxidoreductase